MSKGAKPRDKRSTGKLAMRQPRARAEYHCHFCGLSLGYHPHIVTVGHTGSVTVLRADKTPVTIQLRSTAYYACRNSHACDRRVIHQRTRAHASNLLSRRAQGDY